MAAILILLFTCKLARVALFKGKYLLNSEFKNEATNAYLQHTKEYLNFGHFGTKGVYRIVRPCFY